MAPSTPYEPGERLPCPCQDFTAMSKIVEILESEERMVSLLDWLDGKTDKVALQESRVLSCGKRSRCRFRFGTSFAILNAIRDACRPYLQTLSLGTNDTASGLGLGDSTVSYEESFPTLQKTKPTVKPHPAESNILVPKKKSLKPAKEQDAQPLPTRKKNKKRVKLQPVSGALPTGSVWGQIQAAQTTVSQPTKTTSLEEHKPAFAQPLTPDRPVWGKPQNSRTELGMAGPSLSETQTGARDKMQPTKGMSGEQHGGEMPLDTSNPTNTESTGIGADDSRLENLVRVYVALIRNSLVPSTALELHLLLRLLVLDQLDPINSTTTEASTCFAVLLPSAGRCRAFAQRALGSLEPILQNLSVPMLNVLIQCEPFRKRCPALSATLSHVVEDRIREGFLAEYPSNAIGGSHAILTLPFDKERDSRHNYRTETEVAVYQNREVSRDAFLLELRTFIGIKGKVLRSEEIKRAQERVRNRSKQILAGVINVNMMWFAEFYCELLVQVGLSPIEETDQELLNIADKERLQSLHKRFSSRSTHENRSSKKLALSQRDNLKHPLTPTFEVHSLFPGYQEFFFLFLHQLPYTFGVHVRNRMAHVISDLGATTSEINLERRILEQQLIARFLGYLVFSPNWHDTGIDNSKMQALKLSDGLRQLESLGLPLVSNLEAAWLSGRIVSVIPWMTELLRMAKWDSISQASKQFRQLLANLRNIQEVLAWPPESVATGRCGLSMQLVSFYLERFFHETHGLAKLTSLTKATLALDALAPSDSIDVEATGFSTVLYFSSNPHLEDLLNLIKNTSAVNIGKSPNRTRKLRPSVVSLGFGVEPNQLFSEPQSERASLSGLQDWNSPTKKIDRHQGSTGPDPMQAIEVKLADAFFHQHRVVREICEFSESLALKHVSSEEVQPCVLAAFEERKILDESSDKEIEEAEAQALEKTMDSLLVRLTDSVGKSLELLAPSGIHRKVLEVATRLSIARGMRSGQALLPPLVFNVVKGVRDSMSRAKKKGESKPQDPSPRADALLALASAVESVSGCFEILGTSDSDAQSDQLLNLLGAANAAAQTFHDSDRSMIPPEPCLRRLFEVLGRFHRTNPMSITGSMKGKDTTSFNLFKALFQLLGNLSTLSNNTTMSFRQGIGCDVVVRFMEVAIACEERYEAVNLLQQALDSRVIQLGVISSCAAPGSTSDEVREALDLVQRRE